MYTVNVKIFDIIDSEEKAYALAWFWSRATGRIQIAKKDIEVLYFLQHLLSFTGNINIYRNTASLNIANRNFRNALINVGCVKSKQENQSFPIMSDILLYHFLRGIFDSYGTINIHKLRYLNVSIVHNEDFIQLIRNLLYNELDIQTKHYYRYSHTTTVQMMITRTDDAKKFLQWLYRDANYYLTRKFQKYQQYLQKGV